jgi:S1-C subfamily serine protease
VKGLLIATPLGCIGIVLLFAVGAPAAETVALPEIIDKIKPAIVAVGAFQKTRRPPSIFRGTGFVIADGLHVVTNAHVVPEKLDIEKRKLSLYLQARQISWRSVKLQKSGKIATTTWPYLELPVGH